jgi:hypothetical protein
VSSKPFHFLLVLAVALWAHMCCCTAATSLPAHSGTVAPDPPAKTRSCCKHAESKAPAKAPCKSPGSCGRCVEKKLGLSGPGVELSSTAVALLPAPDTADLIPPAPAAPATALGKAPAHAPTTLLRLHCALIV